MALNATIETARAGDSGKGSIVGAELANNIAHVGQMSKNLLIECTRMDIISQEMHKEAPHLNSISIYADFSSHLLSWSISSMDESKKTIENINIDLLKETLLSNEEWLMKRILDYAIIHGYAAYTSTLKEAWRLSISGLTASILEGLQKYSEAPELNPEENLSEDPVAIFGIVEAQKHRERGVSLNMFLGLMKYYRQAYIDLIRKNQFKSTTQSLLELFLNRIFDRIEIGFCVEWSGSKGDKAIHELQINNRMMTNEKNKYLTIFESIPHPVIILNRRKEIDNMNLEATKLFKDNLIPGSQYYFLSRDRQLEAEQSLEDRDKIIDPACFTGAALSELLPWLESEVNNFLQDDSKSMVFEKEIIDQNNNTIIFHVKISKSLDISGKFDIIIIILEDITSLKKALDEVNILRGFLPICSHCKNIRDDKGFWQKVEKYVGDRSSAEFSHSICPECADKHYPDLGIYDD